MSQKYTEVEWQDPAGGNPGTLINKARLDQMQTAHHYADGFEEVDTAPTADPGVSYHKVVYCTADSTFYRWDGTEWTKDIDDPTRELLEEHEADHANPHQVTKAQVGLGNADNTSDADKPISTATQTALNAKADKSDTYTKTQVDTALATKADKATTYTKTETDTLLGAKADQATTYTKSEVQTYVSNALDGYAPMVRTTGNQAIGGVKDFTAQLIVSGIWDNKVSQNLESTSIWRRIYYTTTTSLSNQVLTLLVTPQKGNNDEAGIIIFYATTAGVSARWLVKGRGAVNDNYCIVKTSGGLYEVWAKNADGNRGLSFMRLNETNWGSTTNNWTRDLTTKDAAFDPTTYAGYAYPAEDDLVRTVDAQTIAGAKTFSDNVTVFKGTPALNLRDVVDIYNTTPSANRYYGIGIYDKNNTMTGSIGLGHYTNGAKDLYINTVSESGTARAIHLYNTQAGTGYVTAPTRGYNASYIDDVATIGTLDAYTPMVRTSGNQTINGTKAFQSGLVGASVQLKTVDMDVTTPGTSTKYSNSIMWTDENNVAICKLWILQRASGQIALGCDIKNSDGSWKFGQILAQGDVI